MSNYKWMDGCLHPFQQLSFILGRWLDDNEKLCEMEPCLRLERFKPQARLETRTLDQ